MKLATVTPRVAALRGRLHGISETQRIRGRSLQRTRHAVMLRDCYTCQACGRVTAYGEVDHIVPLHLGGADAEANMQYLCVPCHRSKTDAENAERGGKGA